MIYDEIAIIPDMYIPMIINSLTPVVHGALSNRKSEDVEDLVYKVGFVCGARLFVTGLLLQRSIGDIRWGLFACPVNVDCV